MKKNSLKESMELIKKDLKLLGISHDIFSETEIVNKDLVNKTVKKLKEKNFVSEGYLKPPKGESNENWKKLKGWFLNQLYSVTILIEHFKK